MKKCLALIFLLLVSGCRSYFDLMPKEIAFRFYFFRHEGEIVSALKSSKIEAAPADVRSIRLDVGNNLVVNDNDQKLRKNVKLSLQMESEIRGLFEALNTYSVSIYEKELRFRAGNIGDGSKNYKVDWVYGKESKYPDCKKQVLSNDEAKCSVSISDNWALLYFWRREST